jgi:hypothetical protein
VTFTIQCAVCGREATRVDVDRLVHDDSWIIRVCCHGETERMTVTRAEAVGLFGPGAAVIEAVAFRQKGSPAPQDGLAWAKRDLDVTPDGGD